MPLSYHAIKPHMAVSNGFAGWAPPDTTRSIRRVLVVLGKISVAGVIIVYMVRTQRLAFARLGHVLRQPLPVIALLFLLLVLALVLAVRWRVLLASQGYRPPFRDVLSLTFIAIFFDSLLPGGTSDIVRGYYFDRNFKPQDRVRAASTVLVDRFLGVLALLLLALVGLSFQAPHEHPGLPELRVTTALVTTLFLLGLLFLCGSGNTGRAFIARVAGRLRGGSVCLKAFDAFCGYRQRQTALLKAVGLSMVGHLLVVGCFWLLGIYLGEIRLDAADYLFLVPVGLFLAQLPISPGGIGVGHVGFYSLFAMVGSKIGADLFSLYIVLHFLSSLPGLACFLALKRRPLPAPVPELFVPEQEELVCR